MSKNEKLLKDFTKYCLKNPEQRFWQALRNWCRFSAIFVAKNYGDEPEDTFYFEGKEN